MARALDVRKTNDMDFSGVILNTTKTVIIEIYEIRTVGHCGFVKVGKGPLVYRLRLLLC